MLTSHSPTPDWAVAKIKTVLNETDDPEAVDAMLELLAAVAPTPEQDKFKHEAAWAAIEYGYTKTADVRIAARRYLGVAVNLLLYLFVKMVVDVSQLITIAG